MEWIEARVFTTAEGAEIVFGVLLDCGVMGAQIIDNEEIIRHLRENPLHWDYVEQRVFAGDDVTVIFYVSNNPDGQSMLETIKNRLSVLPEVLGEITVNNVDDEDWLHEWKKYYKPFRCGKHVVVRPVWETYEVQNEDIVFAINPGSVFGTGLHQTTKLCIEALEDLIAKKSFIDGGSCVPFIDVLDIGCGSGILMLISLLLGARYALGCDFDPAAADNVRENARLNHINEGCFTVITGDIINNDGLIRMVRQRRYHIVACNIVADAVIGVLRMVKDFMLVDGFFIASGIIGERLDEVVSVALKGGLRINGVTEMGGWYCLVCSVEDNA